MRALQSEFNEQFNEQGTGVISTALGAAIFLAFLFLATHTLLTLYANSVITSSAWDAARSVTHSSDPLAISTARSTTEQRLSGFKNVTVDIDGTPDDVAVHVQADRPMFLPKALAKHSGLGRIDKTVHARRETWR